MAWHVARSLDQLLDQLNRLAPRRSKASDGGIGDAAHRSRTSDHNPWYRDTVTARDYTHDPAGGLDCQWLADALVRSRDPRIKYIIWNRRICSGAGGPSPWVWRRYGGSNPHTKHLHLSVVATPAAEDGRAWSLEGAPAPTAGAAAGPTPTTGAPAFPLPRGHYYGPRSGPAQSVSNLWRPRAEWRAGLSAWQSRMRARGWRIDVDGLYGDQTADVVRKFQAEKRLTVDGLIGPATWAAAWTAPVT